METRNRQNSGKILIGESTSDVQTFASPGDLDYEHHLALHNASQLAFEVRENSSRASQAEVAASALASARAQAVAEAAATALDVQQSASSRSYWGVINPPIDTGRRVILTDEQELEALLAQAEVARKLQTREKVIEKALIILQN